MVTPVSGSNDPYTMGCGAHVARDATLGDAPNLPWRPSRAEMLDFEHGYIERSYTTPTIDKIERCLMTRLYVGQYRLSRKVKKPERSMRVAPYVKQSCIYRNIIFMFT